MDGIIILLFAAVIIVILCPLHGLIFFIVDMSPFIKSVPISGSNGKTTKGLYLGNPEAEGENNPNQGLKEFYEDYLQIDNAIAQGRFIIVGRKGVGKSASYTCSNCFCLLVLCGEYRFMYKEIMYPERGACEEGVHACVDGNLVNISN